MRRRALLSIKGGMNLENYLNIVALEDGLTASLSLNDCEYCIDGSGEWKTLAAGASTPSINTGQILSFRGHLIPVATNGIGRFTIAKRFNLDGNCMSMIYGDNAAEADSLEDCPYAFASLFRETSVVNISNNFLSAKILSDSCYRNMFRECLYLSDISNLNFPAQRVASYAYAFMFMGDNMIKTTPNILSNYIGTYGYYRMFYNCQGLINAQQIMSDIVTLVSVACFQMFSGCTSLEKAPVLPALVLTESCYRKMFYGCSKLSYIKALFTTSLSTFYTETWLSGVASSGTFVKNKDATWDLVGPSGVPENWTIEYE